MCHWDLQHLVVALVRDGKRRGIYIIYTGTRIAAHFERVDRGPFVKSGYWLLAFVLFELHTLCGIESDCIEYIEKNTRRSKY